MSPTAQISQRCETYIICQVTLTASSTGTHRTCVQACGEHLVSTVDGCGHALLLLGVLLLLLGVLLLLLGELRWTRRRRRHLVGHAGLVPLHVTAVRGVPRGPSWWPGALPQFGGRHSSLHYFDMTASKTSRRFLLQAQSRHSHVTAAGRWLCVERAVHARAIRSAR